MGKAKALTQSELQEDSKVLLYEVESIAKVAERMQSAPKELVLKNAVVESFAIHFRNVVHFLFAHVMKDSTGQPIKPRDTDIIAERYFASGDWLTHVPALSLALEPSKRNADKQVAHMTTERRGLNESPTTMADWDCDKLLAQLSATLALFLKHVPAANLANDVADRIQAAITPFMKPSGKLVPGTFSVTTIAGGPPVTHTSSHQHPAAFLPPSPMPPPSKPRQPK